MIELPEAVVIASQARDILAEKRIASAAAAHTPHTFAWYTGDPAEYNSRLAGKTIRGSDSCAGHIEIFTEDVELAISAPLRYHAPGEKRPAKHQLLLEFTDGSALSVTIQMWGGIFCVPAGTPGGFWDYDHAKTCPSPLSAAFDRAYFDTLFTAETGKLPAKAFLATEQRIPGLGNGVLQDILWAARVHPKRKMGGLGADEIQSMFTAVKSVLQAMTDQGGRDTERDLFGQPGGYRTVLSKNTTGQPCPACGSLIQKEAFLGGSIYYCPKCQP